MSKYQLLIADSDNISIVDITNLSASFRKLATLT